VSRRLALAGVLLAAATVVPAQAAAPVLAPAAAPAAAPKADELPPMLDPPGEALLAPPFQNRGRELQERSGATNGLCRTLDDLTSLEEPRPDRVVELRRWVTKYYANLRLFDPSGRVTDPESGDEVRLPKEVVRAVDDERRAIFAFQQRVAYAQQLLDTDQIPKSELQERLDHAFVTLANSSFDSAHRTLLAAGRRYC
jgi:hypothetical protein